MAEIKWRGISAADKKIIKAIAARAVELHAKAGRTAEFQNVQMDISALHNNGTPLRLKELLESDDFNFMHEIIGINRHISHTTGKLDGFFLPRFTVKGEHHV